MGRYLYHLFHKMAGEDVISEMPFLDGYVIRDEFGLETFAPTRGRNPLRELDPEEFSLFLDSLMQSGRYDMPDRIGAEQCFSRSTVYAVFDLQMQ